MATIVKTTAKPTLTRSRERLAAPKGAHVGRLSRSRSEARREAGKLREFRDDLRQRRTPEETTARSSLFGGRRNE